MHVGNGKNRSESSYRSSDKDVGLILRAFKNLENDRGA